MGSVSPQLRRAASFGPGPKRVLFILRGHGPPLSKDLTQQQRGDAGVVHPAVGFLSPISALDRLVVFLRELTIPRKATWYVAICGWAVRVGLEAYSGVELPPNGC